MSGCEARREGDTMACGRCGTQWDAKEAPPAACKPVGTGLPSRALQAMARKGLLVAPAAPVTVEVFIERRKAFREALGQLKAHDWKEEK